MCNTSVHPNVCVKSHGFDTEYLVAKYPYYGFSWKNFFAYVFT